MSTQQNILVLCTGNSCRSQLLHGYLQQKLGDHAVVYSAGVETHGLNPRAVQVMAEDSIDISQHSPQWCQGVTVRHAVCRRRRRQRCNVVRALKWLDWFR